MASDVISALDHMKTDPPTTALFNNGIGLVGHSMGAKVAIATVRGVSDDRLGLIKGLVLVAPAPATLVLPGAHTIPSCLYYGAKAASSPPYAC